MPGSIITHAGLWWGFDCYSLIFDVLSMSCRHTNCKLCDAHTGCKESHFYSFLFGQAEASIHVYFLMSRIDFTVLL